MSNSSSARRTLIVGPSWVGDMVMAQSLFKLLRQAHPGSEIDVLAPAWSRPLTERMPEVAASIDMPLGHGQLLLGERYRLGRALAKRGYSRAYILPNSLKSALIPVFAGIETRIGWRGEMRFGLINDIRKLDPKRYPLMVERFAALAFAPGAPLPKALPRPELHVEPEALPALGEQYQLTLERPVLALCPGAEFGPAKQWPAEHYATVAARAIDAGWQVWLFGSEKDRAVAEAIIAEVPERDRKACYSLAGRTSLADAIDLMAAAAAVVSNDSGLMHIAAALGRPLVAVYGSTSADFTPPLSDRVAVVSQSLECQPCFKRECPLEHLRCLRELKPARVLTALAGLTDGAIGQ
ncbi:lipopolysaccharide heptosyltransferase II [uncultured Gilvimarinus sp.]|uniref:lipopolysaccharide heptosyltransferase II n=1 Tax=uncultured Gilvimarinus sp. TaxID=1689143 RepID=UPI0030DC12FD